MSIDTLAVARRLESAKLPREQAEAIAAVFHESETTTLASLATRADLHVSVEGLQNEIEALGKELRGEIEALRKEVRGEIEALRKEVRGEIEALRREMTAELKLLEQRMTIKLGMMMVGAIAILTTLMKLL